MMDLFWTKNFRNSLDLRFFWVYFVRFCALLPTKPEQVFFKQRISLVNTDCECGTINDRTTKFFFISNTKYVNIIFSCRVACSYWRKVTRVEFNCHYINNNHLLFIIIISLSRKFRWCWLDNVMMEQLLTVTLATMILSTFSLKKLLKKYIPISIIFIERRRTLRFGWKSKVFRLFLEPDKMDYISIHQIEVNR